MKFFSTKLFAAACAISMLSVHAKNYSQKTFLNVRPQTDMPCSKPRVAGVSLSAAPFFESTFDSGSLASYFSPNGTKSFTVGAGAGFDVDADWFFGDNGTVGVTSPTARVTLRPERLAAGCPITLSYSTKTDAGRAVYLHIGLPLVYVRQGLRPHFEETAGEFVAGDPFLLSDYFKGSIERPAGRPYALTSLKKARMAQAQDKGGLGAVHIVGGVQAHRGSMFNLFLEGHATIGTEHKQTGDFLFEPVLHNGGHGTLGAAVRGEIELLDSEAFTAVATLSQRVWYDLAATQMRTLRPNSLSAMTQYYRVGYVGQHDEQLIPTANIFTLPLRVTPGLGLATDLNFKISAEQYQWQLAAGMQYNQAEMLKLPAAPHIQDSPLAMVNVMIPATNQVDRALGSLSLQTINLEGAQTPAQLRITFGGDFEYYMTHMLSLGADAQVAIDLRNSAASSYKVGLRLQHTF